MYDATTPDSDAENLAAAAPVQLFPWPPAPGESLAAAAGRTWQGASLSPARFFRAMPDDGSMGAALLYYMPLGILVAGVSLLWSLVRQAGPEQDAVVDSLDVGLGSITPLVEFLLSPLILLISLFLSAAVTHLMLRIFAGASRGIGFTTRIFAYAYSPQLLAVVPVVGMPVAFVWMVVVSIIGLREGHGTTTARAAAAVLIPVAIGLAFVAMAALIAATGALLDLPL